MPTAPGSIAPTAPPPDRNDQILRVARQLEGLFLQEVLRVMRDTVPETSLFKGGLAGDVYAGMLDRELATRAGQTGGLGLADMIARQLGADIAPLAPGRVAATYRQAARGASWVHPLPGGPAGPSGDSLRFGAPRNTDGAARKHMGVDLPAPVGTVVRAVSDGTIERIERDDRQGGRAGRYVRIRHDGGVVTRYLHLAEIRGDLGPGDRIYAGDPVGTVGKTGVRRSGPHLHFAVSQRHGGPGATETYIDPEAWLHALRRGNPIAPTKVGPYSDEGGTMGGSK